MCFRNQVLAALTHFFLNVYYINVIPIFFRFTFNLRVLFLHFFLISNCSMFFSLMLLVNEQKRNDFSQFDFKKKNKLFFTKYVLVNNLFKILSEAKHLLVYNDN